MNTTTNSIDRSVDREPARPEVWVREKGLPRLCHRSLSDRLGRRMLLATDLTGDSSRAEARAVELAEAAGADLLVLGIIPSGEVSDGSHSARLATLVDHARGRGLRAQGRIATSDPAGAILHAARSTSASSIVMADGAWRDWKDAGCVCGHVTVHSSCTVLIVHASGKA